MKEKTLIEMKNKVEAQNRVLQALINEITHMRELSIGTLETVKLMPGYQDAIDTLKSNMEEDYKQRKEKENGAIKSDIK